MGFGQIKFNVLTGAVLGAAVLLNLSVMSIGMNIVGPAGSAPAEAAPPPVPAEVQAIPDPSVISDTVPVSDTSLVGGPAVGNDTATPEATAPVPAAPAAPTPAAWSPAGSTATIVVVPVPAAPDSTSPPTTSAMTAPPATTAAPTTPAPTTASTTAVPANVQYLTYAVDGIADVVVTYQNGQTLAFSSATPLPGWSYRVTVDTGSRIEIEFRRVSGPEGEAKWILTRRNGRLSATTEH